MNRNYDNFLNLTMDTRIRECRDGWYAFEDTVFYGEKGGALADRGTINGREVLELRWEGDTLWHRVEGELSDPVRLEVDRLTRWNNTAVQSAFHMLDGYYGRLGLRIVAIGVHPENQWYELDTKELPPGHLEEVQAFLDRQILDDFPVELSYVKGADYPDPKYQGFDEVRIVKFADVDTQPCGTPHVSRTGQILSFAVLGSERSGRGTKIYTAVGPAAEARLRGDHAVLRRLVELSDTGIPDLPDKLAGLLASSKALKKENEALRRELCGYQAEGLLASGDRLVSCAAKDAGELRAMSQAVLAKAQRGVVLMAELDGGVSFAAISPEGKARAWMDGLKDALEVSGGGSPKIVSGKTPAGPEEFRRAAEGLEI